MSDRAGQLLKALVSRPATLAESATISAALVAAGALYCGLYCLIAFPIHHGAMPPVYSAAWAAHSLLPWFAAFEFWKRALAPGRRAIAAGGALICLLAAAMAAIALERAADIAFGIINTRSVSLRAAAQLPGLTATGVLILWTWLRARPASVPEGRDRIVRPLLPPMTSIDWIGGAGNYVEIHCGDRAVLFRLTMRELEQLLQADDFVRIHRSTIVRRDRIAAVAGAPSSLSVVLGSGDRLRVGQAYRVNLREWLTR